MIGDTLAKLKRPEEAQVRICVKPVCRDQILLFFVCTHTRVKILSRCNTSFTFLEKDWRSDIETFKNQWKSPPYALQKWYAKALSMPIDNADDQAAHDDAQKKIKA